MKIRLINPQRNLPLNGHDLPIADKEKNPMETMTENLQPSTPCQHWVRKQIEFQTIQRKYYKSEMIPRPPFTLTFERQLRSTKNLGQLHLNNCIVLLLLSSLDLKLNLPSVRSFLRRAYHSLSNIKIPRKRLRQGMGKLIFEIMC